MSEYLQLPDDYATRSSVPGKKRVSSRTEVYYLFLNGYDNKINISEIFYIHG